MYGPDLLILLADENEVLSGRSSKPGHLQKWDRPLSLRPSKITCAMGPWPWPSEIVSILSLISLSAASFWRAAIGSAPGDRTNVSGVLLVESPNDPKRSNPGGSINRRSFSPSVMKYKTAGTTLSDLISFQTGSDLLTSRPIRLLRNQLTKKND